MSAPMHCPQCQEEKGVAIPRADLCPHQPPAGHTPFPWRTDGHYAFIHTDAGKVVAQMSHAHSALNWAAEPASLENSANARLIAAAPFLLLALAEVIAELDNRPPPPGQNPDFWGGYTDTGGIALARQAIAQATGQDYPDNDALSE